MCRIEPGPAAADRGAIGRGAIAANCTTVASLRLVGAAPQSVVAHPLRFHQNVTRSPTSP
jgi:hypothetical protein